jgi:broad specificity phosphatase PhoE
MKVYLIRHAKTEDAEKELNQRDSTQIILNKKTQELAKQIRSTIGPLDVVYCSPMIRAKETADLLFGKGEYKILSFIAEYKTPKEIVGKPKKDTYNFWGVEHKKDKMNIYWKPKGGESFSSIANRVEKLYQFLIKEKLRKKHKKVAIVGHGTFFRHFLLRAANVPWTKYPQLIFDVLRKLKWKNLQVIEVEL